MLAINPAESTRTTSLALLVAFALHVAFIALASNVHRAQPAPSPAPLAPTPRAAPARAARATSPRTPAAEAATTAHEILDFGTTLVSSSTSSTASATHAGPPARCGDASPPRSIAPAVP